MTNENASTNSLTNLTPQTLELIKKEIKRQLVKRGFHVDFTLSTVLNRNGEAMRLEIESEDFQTTPVLFEKINIVVSNSGFTVPYEDRADIILRGYVNIGVRYTHFSGGSNGCDLFEMEFKFGVNEGFSLMDVLIGK